MTSRVRLSVTAALACLLLAATGCAPRATKPAATIKPWVESTEATTSDADPETASADATTVPPASSRFSKAEYEALTRQVRLVGVGIAGEGGYVIARYTAPSRLAMHWQPGRLWVVDEATGVKYDKIPIMPKIGALLARPNHPGQVAYVMFENPYGGVRPGSKVTVVLDGFEKKHVVVK
jgi:hypothetical protein